MDQLKAALREVLVAIEGALETEWTPEELCATRSVEDAKEEWTYRLEENHAAARRLLDFPSAKAAADLAAKWLAEPTPSAVRTHEAFEALAKAASAA